MGTVDISDLDNRDPSYNRELLPLLFCNQMPRIIGLYVRVVRWLSDQTARVPGKINKKGHRGIRAAVVGPRDNDLGSRASLLLHRGGSILFCFFGVGSTSTQLQVRF